MSVTLLRAGPTPSSWSLTHSVNTRGQRGGHAAGLAEAGRAGECGLSGPGVTILSTARSGHDDHTTGGGGGVSGLLPCPLRSWPTAKPQCSQLMAGQRLLALADPTWGQLAESEVSTLLLSEQKEQLQRCTTSKCKPSKPSGPLPRTSPRHGRLA